MIDVIIPAYNSHDTIKNTLCSIAYQENIENIKVYIINDGSNINYSKEVELFKNIMDITELTLEKNYGPGVARQFGIDNSNSEYIVFIDSDDVFNNPYSLKILSDNIKNLDCDVLISAFYESIYDGGFIEHINDPIWLHGKIYKRKFLQDNNIRFNDTRANEDNGFNQSLFLHKAKVEYIEDYTYIWMYNEQSITRKNNQEYLFTGLEGYIYNITWAIENAIKDNCDKYYISSLAFSTLIAIYYYYIEFINQEGVEDLLKKSKKLYDIYLKYPIESEEEKTDLWYGQYLDRTKDMSIKEKLNPPLTLEEFFNKIEGM